ncbi:hypothetical protein [Streptomyces aculeolatus]|uniref:hypothetical protein n=1 Tax=Streptomyces aculeolatus TaxID=270689 RepID=UPI001CED67B0|nr:hypothetical protein [Streptomyces aculeolatus]
MVSPRSYSANTSCCGRQSAVDTRGQTVPRGVVSEPGRSEVNVQVAAVFGPFAVNS